MAYVTDRKRAMGMGSARTGAAHHWQMTLSSYALLILTPLFLIAVGPMIGAGHAEVVAHFARPFPAIVTGLMLVVGFQHFRQGVQVLIEDYVHPTRRGHELIAWHVLRAIANAGWLGGGDAPDRAAFDRLVAERRSRTEERNATWFFNQGVILTDQGHVAEAIAKYREALRLQPEDTRARARLGKSEPAA